MSEPRNPALDDDFRRAVCDWLRANGVDPMTVPAEPRASIADGRLTLRRIVQRDGRSVPDPSQAYAVLTETVTVPLLVEPAPDIAEWLRPRCPACGR